MSFMNMRFYNDAVTGSLTLLEFFDDKVLVDCGSFFEGYDKEAKNFESFEFDPTELKAVLITHGHIDHIGRLPWLVKCGFRGKIYCTRTTANIIPVALYDGFNIQQKNRGGKVPYSTKEIEKVESLLELVSYNEIIKISDNTECMFVQNSHIFGAASIFVSFLAYGMDEKINLFFTGDYKKTNPFYKRRKYPFNVLKNKTTIIAESTYGDVTTTESPRYFDKLLTDVIGRGKTVLIPTFSLGRTQEILLRIKELMQTGALSHNIPVEYSGKLGRTYIDMLLRGDMNVDRKKRCLPRNFSYVNGNDEMKNSKNNCGRQKIVLASSGNGSYGTSNTYLRQWLEDSSKAIIFTGYCPEGTLGRIIIDGLNKKVVELPNGQKLVKRAEAYSCGRAFSAHEDQNGMLELISKFEFPQSIILTHGDPEAKEAFKKRILKEINCKKISIADSKKGYTIDQWGIKKETSYYN